MREDAKRVFSTKTIFLLLMLTILCVWQYQNTYIGKEQDAQKRHDYYLEYIGQITSLEKGKQAIEIESLLSQIEEKLDQSMVNEKTDEQEVSELLQRQSALLMLQEQCNYVETYSDYLSKVQSDAEYIQNGSIFASADGYSSKNAAKTASDYAGMERIAEKVSLVPVYSFESIVNGDLTGIVAAVVMLYLSVCLVRFQKRGLWDMIYASPKGRKRFFFGQIRILLIASSISVLILYSARITAAVFLFGESSSWNAPVQCCALFKSCTLPLSMWEMLGLILLFHILGTFASAVFFWLVCIMIRQEKIATLACLGIAAIEFVLYQKISASSNLILLRVLNLVAVWNIQEMMCGYQNIPIGTIPVGQYTIAVVYLACLIGFGAGLGSLIGSRRHPKGTASASERMMEVVRRAASKFAGVLPPIFSEWRKLLFFEHGFLMILLFLWFAYTTFGGKRVLYMYSDSGLKDSIYSEIEGMQVQDAANWLDEKVQRNNADLAELSKAQESYENKKISYDEWNEIRQKFRNSVLYETAYEEIRLELVRLQKLARETNKIIHVVSPFGVNELAGKLNRMEAFEASKYQKRLLWCLYELTTVVFLFAGIFPYEKKTKMEKLLLTSQKGRQVLNSRKCKMAVWTVILLWLIGSFLQFRQIIISGGSFKGLLEPAPVVEVFSKMPNSIPLGLAIFSVCLLRLILLLSVCGILLGIGSKCKTTAQAAAIGTVLFLLPSGVEYLFSLQFFPLSILDAVQNLWEEPIIMLVESGILIALGIVGYIVAIYGHKIQKE